MSSDHEQGPHVIKPAWLKRGIPAGASYQEVHGILQRNKIFTVCQEARCPNLGECFSRGTATFLILGDRCTRNCRFCAVAHGPTGPPDREEPRRVAEAVKCMGLGYVVVTSVTRDDLYDSGAGHFAQTIREIRHRAPNARIEVLVPDFHGSDRALRTIVQTRPDVLNHNLETAPSLYPEVRPGANYRRSLHLLKRVRELSRNIPTKSGLMLGLGESSEEVRGVLVDLLEVDCRILTLGQYLQPSRDHLPVGRFVTPEEFGQWREVALEMGFRMVAAGPLVRSSYRAGELYEAPASILRPSRGLRTSSAQGA